MRRECRDLAATQEHRAAVVLAGTTDPCWTTHPNGIAESDPDQHDALAVERRRASYCMVSHRAVLRCVAPPLRGAARSFTLAYIYIRTQYMYILASRWYRHTVRLPHVQALFGDLGYRRAMGLLALGVMGFEIPAAA